MKSLLLIFLSGLIALSGESREIIDINKGWIIFNPYKPWSERAAQPGDETTHNSDKIDLPHDFSIEAGFDKNAITGRSGGYLPGGKALYRKNDIFVPERWIGKKVYVEFEGIYQNSTVYVNGVKVGFRPNGWVPVVYEISQWLKYGQNNMISVHVDNTLLPNCRWYSGSGIYRPARLIVKDSLNISHFGVYVTTPVIEKEFACIRVKTSVENARSSSERFLIVQEVLDKNGKIINTESSDFYLPGTHSKEFEQNFLIKEPILWDTDNPELYTLKTKLLQHGKLIDETATVFGIRTAEFTVDKGFFLNGKNIKMKGVCLHHDGGMVGSAVPAGVWERRLHILKDMGCNAIRTSHNPFDPAFYELCDKMGFLVMDEFLDEWTTYTLESAPYGSHLYWDEWHEKDLTDLIKRDRNHPSVVIWSVGNEIIEQAFPDGYKIARKLVDLFYSLDPTRPVTCGNNKHIEANMTGFADEFDVVGYNYAPQFGSYNPDRLNYPYRKVIGTESTRGKSNRGVYVFPVSKSGKLQKTKDNYFSSYDGIIRKYGQENEWKITKDLDYVSGMFIWTGIDYIGETTFPFPTKYAEFAPLDVCCFPKDAYYFYRSIWNEEDITLHIFPHWNWTGMEGKNIPVWCYTNCDEVELILNGKSLGKKNFRETDKLHLEWDNVIYEPGTLKAVGYINGKKVKETVIETTDEAAEIHLEADKTVIKSDGKDVVHIVVSTRDKYGKYVPDANNEINYSIKGGKLLGIDSGDPQYVESYKKTKGRKLFNGLSLIIVQSDPEDKFIEITASGSNLQSKKIRIDIR